VNTWLTLLLTAIVGAAVSGVGTYFSLRTKLRSEYDSDLRQKRIDAYSKLWCLLEKLARYGNLPAKLTAADTDGLAKGLQHWYFQDGGLYLSTESRNAFFCLQDVLAQVQAQPETDGPQLDSLRMYGSRLRTGLTYDVGTRSRPRMPGKADENARQGTHVYVYKVDSEERYRLTLTFGTRFLRRKPKMTMKGPGLAMGKRIPVQRWVKQQSTFVVRVPAAVVSGDSPGETRIERELFVEKGVLVMGPTLRDRQSPSVMLWHRA
jgi:hypothetical protein